MERQKEPHQQCLTKISRLMRSLFGEQAQQADDTAEFRIRHGSATVQVRIVPWCDDALVVARAYIASCIELTPDLMRFLLEKNNDIAFGAFGVDPDGSIFLEHSIVGSTCDKAELQATVSSVLTIADEYDDEILRRWGGQQMLRKLQ